MATPDDRRERERELKDKIHKTMYDIEKTERLISKANNPKVKEEMHRANNRRYQDIQGMKDDIENQNRPAE